MFQARKERWTRAILQSTSSLFVALEHTRSGENNGAHSVMHNERFVAAELHCLLQDRLKRAVLNLQSTQVLKSMI